LSDQRETGAIDWLLVEAKNKEMNGELVPPLLDLVDRGLINVLDAIVIVKRSDDDYDVLTSDQLDPDKVGDLGALEGVSSGLLSDDDAAAAAGAMEANSLGFLVVYENLWSLPFATAVRKAGGQVITQGHIPIPAIMAALDALEA
jgi:hypothetical protein